MHVVFATIMFLQCQRKHQLICQGYSELGVQNYIILDCDISSIPSYTSPLNCKFTFSLQCLGDKVILFVAVVRMKVRMWLECVRMKK